MTDPVTPRPELPDPQHDRHVAFPGDEPVGGSPDVAAAEGAAAGAARGPVVGTTLPPEAWAPRSVETSATASSATASAPSSSSWQPNIQPGSVLTTPPNRPYAPSSHRRSGSPGAKLLAALVIVPVMFGFFSNGSQDYGATGGGGAGVEMPMDGGVPDSVYGVWVEVAVDTTPVEPALSGKPRTAPVPAGTTSLRVEVVGADKADIDPSADVLVETSAGGATIDTTNSPLPFASTVHIDERPASLVVTATDLSGTARLQCRVYAGDRLVAVSNAAGTVTCTPEL